MNKTTYQAKAPGSLMLTGEYAVLEGYPALVCAIDQHITTKLTPREDQKITLQSDHFGYHETTLDTFEFDSKFKLIFAVFSHYRTNIETGFDLEITSTFPSIGLGSSGALTVGLLAIFQAWIYGEILPHSKFLTLAIHIIHQAQGLGSGSDAIASLLGGIIYYQYQPQLFEKIEKNLPLSLIYSGKKSPTENGLKVVQKHNEHHPSLFEILYQGIGECSHSARQAIEDDDLKSLGEVLNIQHGLMNALGISTGHLNELVEKLKNDPGIFGAKISGAGLGDCVIGLGNYEGEKTSKADADWIEINMTQQGLICEQI